MGKGGEKVENVDVNVALAQSEVINIKDEQNETKSTFGVSLSCAFLKNSIHNIYFTITLIVVW